MTTPLGPTVVDLDDMEAMAGAGNDKPVDLATIKFDGEGVPEDLKGKTALEVIEYNKRLQDALRVSEVARSGMQAQPAAPAPAPIASPEPKEEELDPEKIRQMFAEDPVGAFNMLQDRWAKKADAHLNTRLAPLVSGAASAAEATARMKYPQEFALFERDIKSIVDGMPASQRAAMSNPAAWDDLIGYVRGKPGNFEKLIQDRTDKALKEVRKTTAQQQQELDSGLTLTDSSRRPPARTTDVAPDATTAHICEVMGMTYADYVKWSKVS